LDNDCSVELPKKTPLSTSVEVAVVWGLAVENAEGINKAYKSTYNDKGEPLVEPVYNDKFEYNQKQIQTMHDFCALIRTVPKNKNLMVRDEQPCWVERYYNHNSSRSLEGSGDAEDMSAALTEFMEAKHEKTAEETGNEGSSKPQYWNFKSDVVTDGSKYEGVVKMVQIRVRINLDSSTPARAMELNYTHWATFIEEWNSNAEDGNKVILVSSSFTKMDTELRIVRSTFDSWMLSNVICLISVLLFTQNIVISLYTMLAIFLIVASLMGIIFGIAGYPFGAIEAVGITIFVGLSVDYCLHTAHGYAGSAFTTRKERVQDMLTKLGVSIAGAAVTTAGSCIFLFFCHIFLFLQLGVMLFANCLIAVVFR
jgi:predicted RND superfamily exporter protein